MLVTGSQKTTVLKGTTFVDTLLGWGVTQDTNGSVTEDITKVAHESMFGNSGNDRLSGGAGNDKLYGEVGNDILNGGSGNDFLDGGSGTDTAIFKSPAGSASFGWVNGKLTVTTSEGVDTLVNIENLQFGGQTFKISDVPIAINDSIAATENLLDVAAATLLSNDFSAKAGWPPLAIQTDSSGVVGQTTEGVNIYLGGDGRLHFADGETGYNYLSEGETLKTHFSYEAGNDNGLTDTADVALEITGGSNNSFESGFTDWQYLGYADVVGTDNYGNSEGPPEGPAFLQFEGESLEFPVEISPTDGIWQARLGGSPPEEPNFNLAPEIMTGNAPQEDIESFLGLESGTLDAIDSSTEAGSAIKMTIYANSDVIISFDWFHVVTESGYYNDYSFYMAAGGTVFEIIDNETIGYNSASGWQTTTFFVAATDSGSFEIGFGAMNFEDSEVDPLLYIDNITVTAADLFV